MTSIHVILTLALLPAAATLGGLAEEAVIGAAGQVYLDVDSKPRGYVRREQSLLEADEVVPVEFGLVEVHRDHASRSSPSSATNSSNGNGSSWSFYSWLFGSSNSSNVTVAASNNASSSGGSLLNTSSLTSYLPTIRFPNISGLLPTLPSVKFSFFNSTQAHIVPANATPTQIYQQTWSTEANEVAHSSLLLLIGTIFFFLVLVTMISVRDVAVQLATAQVLSSFSSLLCVMLLYVAMGQTWFALFGASVTSSSWALTMAFVRWLLLVIILPRLLQHFQGRVIAQSGWTTMGSHLVGLAGIMAWGGMLQKSPWQASPGYFFLGLLVAILGLSVTNHISTIARARELARLAEAGETGEDWCRRSEDMEVQSNGLIVGFVIAMLIRFSAVGQIPDLFEALAYKSSKSVSTMWIVTCLYVPIACAAVVMLNKKLPDVEPSHRRHLLNAKAVLTTSSGFQLLNTFQWSLWSQAQAPDFEVVGSEASRLSAAMSMALTTSFFVFLSIFLINFAARAADRDRAATLRDFVEVFSLILAFSWRYSIYTCIQGVSQQWDGPTAQALNDICLIVAVCSVTLPVWVFSIMPLSCVGPTAEEGSEVSDAKQGLLAGKEPGPRLSIAATGTPAPAAPAAPAPAAPATQAPVAVTPAATSAPVPGAGAPVAEATSGAAARTGLSPGRRTAGATGRASQPRAPAPPAAGSAADEEF